MKPGTLALQLLGASLIVAALRTTFHLDDTWGLRLGRPSVERVKRRRSLAFRRM